mmetsp:Transcript_18593/g.38411  ORF Transcript_18593/g.38411 Transcript_18593/m.38411 type:complete len:110 (+) Transcript_18593:110-439(+)
MEKNAWTHLKRTAATKMRPLPKKSPKNKQWNKLKEPRRLFYDRGEGNGAREYTINLHNVALSIGCFIIRSGGENAESLQRKVLSRIASDGNVSSSLCDSRSRKMVGSYM